eukprot:scaffold116549_cov34-Tisochrysis_lutea.AAC.2
MAAGAAIAQRCRVAQLHVKPRTEQASRHRRAQMMSIASHAGDWRTRSRIGSVAGATATTSYARRASRAPVSANAWLSSSRERVRRVHCCNGRVNEEEEEEEAGRAGEGTSAGGLGGTAPVASLDQHTTE